MLKSMYSGISGMKSNQTKMDVVGNNVANASTTAFKKSSVRFSDTLNQTVIYSSQPSNSMGGVNPGQVLRFQPLQKICCKDHCSKLELQVILL